MDQTKKVQLDEDLDAVSGGLLVDEGNGKQYWLVRRDGSVIAPVPVEKGAEFAKAYGLSDKVVTKEEYRMCLLIKTGRFRPKEIEILLGWKFNFTSKKRQQLLKKIFKVDGRAIDFDQRIKELA